MVLNPIIPRNNILTPAHCAGVFGIPDRDFSGSFIHRFNFSLVKFSIPCLPDFIRMHDSLFEPLLLSLNSIIDNNQTKLIKTFDGCYNVRYINHSKNYSLHSYGLAIDFNSVYCPPGNIGTINSDFAHFFIENGFNWGGNFSKRFHDEMHFEIKYSKLLEWFNKRYI